MKKIVQFSGITIIGVVVLTGCGQKEETMPAPAKEAVAKPATMPAAPAAPAAPAVAAPSAPASTMDLLASAKTGVENAMALAKAGKYNDALALLQQKAAEVQANPTAKKLIDDAVVQIKQMAKDAATKALNGLGK